MKRDSPFYNVIANVGRHCVWLYCHILLARFEMRLCGGEGEILVRSEDSDNPGRLAHQSVPRHAERADLHPHFDTRAVVQGRRG